MACNWLSWGSFVNLQSQRVCRSLRLGFRFVLLYRADHRFAIALGSVQLNFVPAEYPNGFAALAFDSLQTAFLMTCTPHVLLPSDSEHGWPEHSVFRKRFASPEEWKCKSGQISSLVHERSTLQSWRRGNATACLHALRGSGPDAPFFEASSGEFR